MQEVFDNITAIVKEELWRQASSQHSAQSMGHNFSAALQNRSSPAALITFYNRRQFSNTGSGQNGITDNHFPAAAG